MKNKQKVNFFNSMAFKVQCLLGIGVILALMLMAVITFPNIQANIEDVNQSYLFDEAKAYGRVLEATSQVNGKAVSEFSYDELSSILKNVAIEGCSSSYAYLVNSNGTMLFHPDSSKVGNPVENIVVTGLVADLKAGKSIEPSWTEYDYRGTAKYAAYYVSEASDAILVITVDRMDILSGVLNVFIRMIVASLIAVVVIVGIGTFAAVKMLKPLTTLTGILNKAAELDFTPVPEQEKLNRDKSETGMISRATALLMDELKEMISLLTEQSNELARTNVSFNEKFDDIAENVSSINVAIEEIAQGSTSQAQETTSAGEQVARIGLAIDENVRNVEKLETTVTEMNQLSEQAEEMLSALVEINKKTTKNIDVVSVQTNSTHASAEKIKEAVNMIRDIAEQTNLLSLNASIEAARAGEAGRGFSVVAEEIRKLADDSANSAGEIEVIVQELITNSDTSVEKMEEVNRDAEEQKNKLSQTQNSFQSLRNGVDAISKVSTGISEQTNELENGKNIISTVVEQLAAISEENAASTQETSASMQTLAEAFESCKEETSVLNMLSEELAKQMKKFKI